MILADERWVIYMRASVGWSPRDAPAQLSMREVVTRLEKAIANKRSSYHPDLATRPGMIVTIDQVALTPKNSPTHATILITYSDDRGADPGFQNRNTGGRRVAQKRAQEANAASAHLVIALDGKVKKGVAYHAALLEDMAGVGKTKIAPTISEILRQLKYTFKDENKNVVEAKPTFNLEALQDEKLQEDANKGVVSYFVATREVRNNTGFDEEGYTTLRSESIKLKPTKDVTKSNLIAQLKAVVKSAKRKDFDRVQVQYKREDGKSRSVTYNTHREDAEDFLIKRIELVSLKQPLAQTSLAISIDLQSKMIALLKAHSKP